MCYDGTGPLQSCDVLWQSEKWPHSMLRAGVCTNKAFLIETAKNSDLCAACGQNARSAGYFLLTFFSVEGAVHSGKCASPTSLLPSVWQYSTWKSKRVELKMASTSKEEKKNSLKFSSPPAEHEPMFSCRTRFTLESQPICICLRLWAPSWGGCDSDPANNTLRTVKGSAVYSDPLLQTDTLLPNT